MRFESTIDFVKEQFPNQDFIPLHVPTFAGNEKKYLLDTIDSTFVSSVGAYVDRFEEMMSNITDTKKAVAMVNGTAGLQVALRLVGVGKGDEVITQALTFVATANAISYNGANPVFVDVDLDTMGLSPSALTLFLDTHAEKRPEGTFNKLTNNKIAACVPMHTFGFMTRIEEIVAICDSWSIRVVEDAAEALGSTYRGKQAGSFGAIGVFSFNGNKIVTCGGGGAIVTNTKLLAEKGKHLTTTAKVPHKWDYVHDELGYNFRMPNLNAALACAQLEQLDKKLESKELLADAYSEFFVKEGVTFRQPPVDSTTNNWLMCVELENKEQRDLFLEETNNNGVMTRPIWQLMFRTPMYEKCYKDNQKNAQFLEERIVNIPSSARNK